MKPADIRAAAYYRVSSQRQAEALPMQRARVHAYCKEHDLPLVAEYEEIKAATGGKRRDALEECLAAAEAGAFDIVVVSHSSRAFRNVEQALGAQKRLTRAGVTLVDVTEPPTVMETADRRMVARLRWVVDAREGELIGERLASKRQYLAEQGKWPGGAVPFGLSWDRQAKCLRVDEEKARDLVRLFELFIYHAGRITAVATQLNEEGIPSPRGKAWSSAGVTIVVNNPIYRGQLRFRGEFYDLKDPAPGTLIPAELLAEATRILRARRQMPRVPHHREYLFSGLVVCGGCGGKCAGRAHCRGKKGITYRYYHCIRATLRGCPNRKAMREDKLAECVVGAMAEALRRHADRLPAPDMPGTARLTDLRERHQRLLDGYEAGAISWADFAARTEEIRRHLQEEEERLSMQGIADEDLRRMASSLEAQWDTWDFATRRRFVVQFLDHVTVAPDHSVEVVLRDL